MRIRSLLVLAALAAVIAIPATGQAAACNGTITKIVGDGSAGSATVYLDDRSTDAPDDINHWFYAESNGVAGLQTGGEHPVLGDIAGFTDTCDNYTGSKGSDLLLL